VEECAPEEFRFKLKKAGDGPSPELNPAEIKAIRSLRDNLIARIETITDDKSCAEAIYKIAEDQGMEGKALFRAAYQALIGKDQGPRLANFLRSISKERLLGILAVYI
jgi:lysyl-tRNA synthetase class 1